MKHPHLAGPQPSAVPGLCFPQNISVELNLPYRLVPHGGHCSRDRVPSSTCSRPKRPRLDSEQLVTFEAHQ